MADQQHPITPPPELVMQWVSLACEYEGNETWIDLATQAARWGADAELEACCEHLRDHQWGFIIRSDGTKVHRAVDLQLARRPKPPSLAEEALAELKEIMDELHEATGSGFTASAINAALERLQELENNG